MEPDLHTGIELVAWDGHDRPPEFRLKPAGVHATPHRQRHGDALGILVRSYLVDLDLHVLDTLPREEHFKVAKRRTLPQFWRPTIRIARRTVRRQLCGLRDVRDVDDTHFNPEVFGLRFPIAQ